MLVLKDIVFSLCGSMNLVLEVRLVAHEFRCEFLGEKT